MPPREVETEHNNNSFVHIRHRSLLGALGDSLQLSASNTTTTNGTTGNAQVIHDQQTISDGAIAIVVILIALLIALCVSTFYCIHTRRRRSKRLRNMVELGTVNRRLEFSLVSDPIPSRSSQIKSLSSTSSSAIPETNYSHLAVSQVLSNNTKPESSVNTISSRSTTSHLSTKTKGSTNTSTSLILVPSGETASIKQLVGGDGSIKGDERPPTTHSSIAPPGHVLRIMNITKTDVDTQSPGTAVDSPDDLFETTTDVTFKQRIKERMSYADLPRISTDFGIKDTFKIELPYLNRTSGLFKESSSIDQSSSNRDSLEIPVPHIRKIRMSTRSLTSTLSSPKRPRGARPIPRSNTGHLRPHSAADFP
ncbi:hypothetical protein Clacol_000296 [Clathrus columnatus]|uniref:Uncharacterized protein n=1 Tax=Clathrus columnatus TaxID=1419009 RepID=A0AAV4ZWG3_9AGAM|nr:hypothetical protein Clacol_000296 [Clathrus columnatus]